MNAQEAMKAFQQADDEYQAALERVYGKNAGDARYSNTVTNPDILAARQKFHEAASAWRACRVR